ncbi:MAG: gliding motility-associated C-terminal domain-containing protein, partial [Sphingobacteriales bacterium]
TCSSIWKTSLAHLETTNSYIAGMQEKTGVLKVVTQQYPNIDICNSANNKSIGLIELNSSYGNLLSSKSICLNYSDTGCYATWDNFKPECRFMTNGEIAIAGGIATCGNRRLYSLLLDKDFNIIKNIEATNINQRSLYGLAHININPLGQVSLFARSSSPSALTYATLNKDFSIYQERKINLQSGTFNTTGRISAVFKRTDDFILFSNLLYNGENYLQVMEAKGNNNETADCSGEDTTFINTQPHSSYVTSFAFDSIKTEIGSSESVNYPLADFVFQRVEICHTVSICDSLKIKGKNSFCLSEPEQIYTFYKNAECLKKPKWLIDTSAISYMVSVNDSTVRIKFKKQWSGYLYVKSNSCEKLNDSLFIQVYEQGAEICLGNDTTFCKETELDAGINFTTYQWQDGSIDQFYTAKGPGKFFVTAKDNCGNIFSDTIELRPKLTQLFIGNDTCVTKFPLNLYASLGFKNYMWDNTNTQPWTTINEPGLYFLETTNTCGESFIDSIYIYKNVSSFTLGENKLLCPGSTLKIEAPIGYKEYKWGDEDANRAIWVNKTGSYSIIVTDFCGNKITDSISVDTLAFNNNALKDITICQYESVKLSLPSGALNYNWNPLYNIDKPTGQSVVVNPELTTTYIGSSEILQGCFINDSVTITVKDCPLDIFVPTVFTPNNDGKNDLFKPAVSLPLEVYRFEIYNRWGQKIYETQKITEGWDGQLNGRIQPQGTFIWVLHYKKYNSKEMHLLKGMVVLIR